MKCSVCGAELTGGYNFCSSCGSPVKTEERPPQQGYYQQPPVRQGPIYNNSTQVTNNYGLNQPVSVSGWIGRSLIPFIPFVGGIIYIIMLFIWSGDQTKELSFRNWAKAQLVVMGILIGISLIIFLLFLATGMLTYFSMSNPRYYY